MIIGIDPGFSGAIALLSDDVLEVYDLPVKKVGNHNQICPYAFSLLIPDGVSFGAVEEIGARPNQGIASTARFTYNAGILYGVLAAKGVPVVKVMPAVWKSALGLGKSKKDSLSLARKLFPSNKESFRLMKHDGRAEAALIAHFAKTSIA